MSCSKLFSGDLPETSTCIIQNLRNNFNTLYSLALVSRFWCRLAIPLLWEDPFSIKHRKNFHFLDTYFLFLNNNDKNKMKEIIISYEFDFTEYKHMSQIGLTLLFYNTKMISYFPLTSKCYSTKYKKQRDSNEKLKVIYIFTYKY